MRLFEVADRFVDDLTTILRELVGRADAKHAPQQLAYPALSNMLANMGYGTLGFDQFSRVYDENPQVQELVADFNEDGITLGTKDQVDQAKTQLPTGIGAKTVDQMASAGAKAHLNSLSN